MSDCVSMACFHYYMIINVCILLSTNLTVATKVKLNRRGLREIPFDQIPMAVAILELRNNKLTSLQDHIFVNHTLITKLDLWKNKITDIANGTFQGLDNLKVLKLGGNLLALLPDLTLVSDSLECLELQENMITNSVQDTIIMEELKYLKLDSNKLTEISATNFVYVMPKVKTLSLKSNKIASIADGIFSISTYLEELLLSNNALSEFSPSGLGISSNLTKLYLNKNNIQNLDSGSFAGLVDLQILQLDDNQITSFDIGLLTYDEGFPSLLELHIAKNKISTMPPNTLLPSNITIFKIGKNQITGVSHDFFANFSDLVTLNLDSVSLTQMPTFSNTMIHLEEIILSNNGIITMDLSEDYISKLPALKHLNLAYNKVSAITGPVNITLSHLVTLNLENNKIKQIPNGFFDAIPALKVLKLKRNNLTSLQILSNLSYIKVINLDYNKLTSFPTFSETTLQNVEKLYVSNNLITNPITINSLYGSNNPQFNVTSLRYLYLNKYNSGSPITENLWRTMPNLQRLSLQETGLTSIPDLKVLTKLTHLYLEGNTITNLEELASLKQNSKLRTLALENNELKTVDYVLELANGLSSDTLLVDLQMNNLTCESRMCWMKYMSLK